MAGQHHQTWTIRLTRALALAAALGLPAAAQDSPPPARPGPATGTAPETLAADAAARLDFPAALEALAAEIAADPAAPAPRLARADIHMKMQRPALALADLGAVLDTDPANLPALRARVAIWEGQQAWNRARDDLDAALAAAPDHPQVLALRGQVNARAGLTEAARADFAAALAAAPGDPGITRLRDDLLGPGPAPTTQTPAPTVVFGEEAVMSSDFTVEIGAPEAPATLHIVHAATDLAAELTAVDPALVDRAVTAGALRVVHVFTYTGDEASIWGSLALICAGSEGYAATHAALSDSSGSDALAAAGAGDMAPLERLLTAAYSVAGIDEGLVQSCALDRPSATRYLADWHAHRDAGAWRGVDLLDHWPVWVLDGAPLGAAELTRRLTAMSPAPQARAEDAPSTVTAENAPDATPPADGGATPAPDTPDDPGEEPADEGSDTVAALAADAPGRPAPDDPEATQAELATDAPVASPQDTAPDGTVPAPETAVAPEVPSAQGTAPEQPATGATVPQAETALAATPATPLVPETSEPAPEPTPEPASETAPARFPDRPEPVDNARVPVELRGIYAPSLAACLDYLAGIEAPDRIDAVLPGINPIDGPALGTVLVTSRRAYLFNALDTECAITGEETGDTWEGRFTCASPLAPEAAPTLTLSPAEPDGTAPRVAARFGEDDPVTLRQCRALGQLGNAFAPLWTRDDAACSVGAAIEPGRFAFTIDPAGNLVLRVAPRKLSPTTGTAELYAVIDGAAIGAAPGRWDGTGWQMSLGPFADAADRLGWGMFLDLRTAGDPFEARLPLFGSSAAMDSLETCAPADN